MLQCDSSNLFDRRWCDERTTPFSEGNTDQLWNGDFFPEGYSDDPQISIIYSTVNILLGNKPQENIDQLWNGDLFLEEYSDDQYICHTIDLYGKDDPEIIIDCKINELKIGSVMVIPSCDNPVIAGTKFGKDEILYHYMITDEKIEVYPLMNPSGEKKIWQYECVEATPMFKRMRIVA